MRNVCQKLAHLPKRKMMNVLTQKEVYASRPGLHESGIRFPLTENQPCFISSKWMVWGYEYRNADSVRKSCSDH